MLQPRRKRLPLAIVAVKQKQLFPLTMIIGVLSMVSLGLTQNLDEVPTVGDTKVYALGEEGLTTVLLVNNDSGHSDGHHGRYLSVRPEVGMLTSTARTFIQEGITTEYATQVVGTTLDNGRLYAQYLKKSSRVLFDNEPQQVYLMPSVVTSWVGESLHTPNLQHTKSLPQSHNDLFNAEQPDWQDIDDRLLLDRNVVVGNTDFVNLKGIKKYSSPTLAIPETQLQFISSVDPPSLNVSPHMNGRTEQRVNDTRKLAASKVLPIGDLPTYTVKNSFSPSVFLIAKEQKASTFQGADSEDTTRALNRSPKLYYQHLMGANNAKDLKTTVDAPIMPRRHLSSITYYGFADFTTIVADSVIVFSPRTSMENHNLGHVTSIQGEATIAGTSSTIISQEEISPTHTSITDTQETISVQEQIKEMEEHGTTTDLYIDTVRSVQAETTVSNTGFQLETSEIVPIDVTLTSTLNSEVSKSANTGLTSSIVMLSRPTDEEILRIYASLANVERGTAKSSSSIEVNTVATTIETDTTVITESVVPSLSTPIVLQTLGGATTIFFEDDPFTNFVEPTATTQSTDSSTPNKTQPNILENVTDETTTVDPVTENVNASNQTNTNANVTELYLNVEDYSEIAVTSVAITAPALIVKEIADVEANNLNCIHTSQIFWTQLPKISTYFTTYIQTDKQVATETHVVPTFDIMETTKYYCIQPTTVVQTSNIDTIMVQQQQLEKPLIDSLPIIKETTQENAVSNFPETTPADETTDTTTIFSVTSEELETTMSNDDVSGETESDSIIFNSSNEDSSEDIELIYKTLYTTYTYLTTFFHEETTSISSHTEVVTNIITSTLGVDIEPTELSAVLIQNKDKTATTTQLPSAPDEVVAASKFIVSTELENIIREGEKGDEEKSAYVSETTKHLDDSKITKTLYTTYTYYTTIFADNETEIMSRTKVHTNFLTDTSKIVAKSVVDSMLGSNSATGNAGSREIEIMNTVLSVEDNVVLEDLISSTAKPKSKSFETTAPHLNYSTMTRGFLTTPSDFELKDYAPVTLVTDVRSSSSNGAQHIINNVHRKKNNEPIDDQISSESNTEEIFPSATLLLQTSFTTFTYYTTMYNGDSTNVASRLETVTNVVTETLHPTKVINMDEATLPITYFTTFIYWTKLSKDGEISTLSREETVSNVVTPTNVFASRPADTYFDTAEIAHTAVIVSDTTSISTSSNALSELPAESILPYTTVTESSIMTMSALEPTTYYTTYTYYTTSYELNKTITDSRYETITNIVTPTTILKSDATSNEISSANRTVSRNITDNADNTDNKVSAILYDHKKIIDADGISTLYFTTQILPTTDAGGLPSEFVTSTSSLYIDELKKALVATTNASSINSEVSTIRQYKTGLVRLIEGTRVGNHTTTLYESKVIGTIIDNRYAQIIESTSSFLFENMVTDTLNISPSITQSGIQATAPHSLDLLNPDVVQSSLNEHRDDDHTSEQPVTQEDNYGDDDGDGVKGQFPLQSKKRTFTPVIRPFASRNRPQFAPKKKNISPSSALIISRTDFTPTITVTPALKSSPGRFSSARRGGGAGSSSSAIVTSASGYGTLSRRFSRPSKNSIGISAGSAVSSTLNSGFGGARSRLSSTRAFLVSSSRRVGPILLPSSVGFRSGLSSSYAGNSRLRFKSTSSVILGQQGGSSDAYTTLPPENSGEEENSTQEQLSEEEEEITTENSRRSQNPLLRFRKPLNRPSAFTPASIQRPHSGNSLISTRRNPLSGRAKTTTSTTTATSTTVRPRPRSFQKPRVSPNRSRGQNSLFPPRRLFQANKESVDSKDKKKSEDELNDGAPAEDDSEYEDDDDDDDKEGEDDTDVDVNRRRRSNSKPGNSSKLSISNTTDKNNTDDNNLSEAKHSHRKRRDADTSSQTRSNFRNRFRRPKLVASVPEDKEIEHDSATPTTGRSHVSSRFGSRKQSLNTHHSTTTVLTSASNHRAIRPTRPTSGRAQFTLREKATTSTTQKKGLTRPNSNFRRPQTAASSRRSSAPTTSSRRLKAYSNNSPPPDLSSRNTPSRQRNGNLASSSRSRGTTVRGRNRNEYNVDPVAPGFDGRITVTHAIPAEVSIPVVNGKVTEYKNVVTAKTSTEILGPQQYTSFVGGNGMTTLALTREETSVNFAGATEITQFILLESPTTTVTFTPTTIRGRKTSFSHIIPSTVYSVESVVSTTQPQISANAPLANILLSQLLLGNIGLPSNPLLGALGSPGVTQPLQLGAPAPLSLATPVTEFRTHTSTYVTTLVEGMSTVLSVTFQGKKILTTVYDTTAQAITATEFITDTIVTTPSQQVTQVAQAAQVNSLLLQQLLLQQQLQPQMEQSPLPILHSKPPTILLSDNLQELDANIVRLSDNDYVEDIPIVEEMQTHKGGRKKPRKSGKNHKRNKQQQPEMVKIPESTVITLYVSGRRPEIRGTAITRETFANHIFLTVKTATSNGSQFPNNHSDDTEALTQENSDEARYNLATRIMSNGVEVIIASDKIKTNDNFVAVAADNLSVIRIVPSHTYSHKRMTLAPSTLKNQMILIMPANAQESFTIPINGNQFITKTCLTTFTYRTTYLQDGQTMVESREQVITNTATEERNYLKMSLVMSLGVTLTNTPELAIGVFPTTYSYYNTILDGELPLVLTSQHTVINTITGPDDYISFLQPSEEVTPVHDTNTYYTKVTLTKTLSDGDIQTIVTTSNLLTQVIVTESLAAHSTSVLTSYYAFDEDEENLNETEQLSPTAVLMNSLKTNTNILRTKHTNYFDNKGKEQVEICPKSTQNPTTDYLLFKKNECPSSTRISSSQSVVANTGLAPADYGGDDDMHIYATKTYLTTFTYFTTSLMKNTDEEPLIVLGIESSTPISSITKDRITTSTVVDYHTRVIENVITETVPNSLLSSELLLKFRTKLKKLSKSRRQVIVTVATLVGGQTLQVTAMKMLRPITMPWDSLSYTPISPIVYEHDEINSLREKSNSLHIADSRNQPTTVNTLQTKAVSTEFAGVTRTTKLPDMSTLLSYANIVDNGAAGSEQEAVYIAPPPPVIVEQVENSGIGTKLQTAVVSKTNGSKVKLEHDEVHSQIPVAVSHIFGTLNLNRLTALRPVINAMADLLQSNFISTGVSTHMTPIHTVTSKHGLKHITADSFNELLENSLQNKSYKGPIYIPVQTVIPEQYPSTLNNLYNNIENSFVNLTEQSPQSLHIRPLYGELPTSDDNWLQGTANRIYQNNLDALTDMHAHKHSQQQTILNGGIPIRPGEVITANSDVIIGKPNGIQDPRVPLKTQLTRLSDAAVSQHMSPMFPQLINPPANQMHFYRELHKNVLPVTLSTNPNIIPLVDPVSIDESQQILVKGNLDKILKPPPLPANVHKTKLPLLAQKLYLLSPPPSPQQAIPPVRPLTPSIVNTNHLSYSKPAQQQQQPKHHQQADYMSFIPHLNSPSHAPPKMVTFHNHLRNNEILEFNNILSTHFPKPNNVNFPHGKTQGHMPSTSLTSGKISNHSERLAQSLPNTPTKDPTRTLISQQVSSTTIKSNNSAEQPPVAPLHSNHQHINLDINVLSHNVDMNVPPLTFNKESADYPQSTPVRGQIVSQLNGPTNIQYAQMPHIKIPITEEEVQVNLSPLNMIGSIAAPIMLQSTYNKAPYPGGSASSNVAIGSFALQDRSKTLVAAHDKQFGGQLQATNNLNGQFFQKLNNRARPMQLATNEYYYILSPAPIDFHQNSKTLSKTQQSMQIPYSERQEVEGAFQTSATQVDGVSQNKPEYEMPRPLSTSLLPPNAISVTHEEVFKSEDATSFIPNDQKASPTINFGIHQQQQEKQQHQQEESYTYQHHVEPSNIRKWQPNQENSSSPDVNDLSMHDRIPAFQLPTTTPTIFTENIIDNAKMSKNKFHISQGQQFSPIQKPTDNNNSKMNERNHLFIFAGQQFKHKHPQSAENTSTKQQPAQSNPMHSSPLLTGTTPIELEVHENLTRGTPTPNSFESFGTNVTSYTSTYPKPQSPNEIFVLYETNHPHNHEAIYYSTPSNSHIYKSTPAADMQPPPPPLQSESVLGMNPPLPLSISLSTLKTTTVATMGPQKIVKTTGLKRFPPSVMKQSAGQTPKPNYPNKKSTPLRLPAALQTLTQNENKSSVTEIVNQPQSTRTLTTSVPMDYIYSLQTNNRKHHFLSSMPFFSSTRPETNFKTKTVESSTNTTGTHNTKDISPTRSSIKNVIAPSFVTNDDKPPSLEPSESSTYQQQTTKHIQDTLLITTTNGIEARIYRNSSEHKHNNIDDRKNHEQILEQVKYFTRATTPTLKRMILNTKYITNTLMLTVTTTKTTEITTAGGQLETTTLRLIKTQIATVVDTITKIHTLLQPTRITESHIIVATTTATETTISTTTATATATATTTTTTTTTATIAPTINASISNYHYNHKPDPIHYSIADDSEYKSIPGLYDSAPASIEVVLSANGKKGVPQHGIYKQELPDKSLHNSIFIVMNKKTKSHNDETTSSSGSGAVLDDVLVTGSDKDDATKLDYDDRITFDVPTRDEESDVPQVNKASHNILLGGVFIATPSKIYEIPINHHTASQGNRPVTITTAESVSRRCRPECTSTRNEVCLHFESRMQCVCRPGFARMFPDRPCKPTYTYAMQIHTNRIGNKQIDYNDNLTNNKSELYLQLTSITRNAIDRMVMQSDFRDVYHGVQLTAFNASNNTANTKNVLANFLLQLSDNSDERRLENVFKKYLRLSNYSIGGTELFTSRNGVESLEVVDFNECIHSKFHDCSENAHCFNLQGTYTCSCLEGYVDLSENTMYPGRLCSAELIGCEKCHYHGKCATASLKLNGDYGGSRGSRGTRAKGDGSEGGDGSGTQANALICECFPWYSGASCQLNLKIFLIALIATGTLLFILLLFCTLITCTKRNRICNTRTPITFAGIQKITKNTRLSATMPGVSGRGRHINIDKRAMIKESSSESSQNSLPYVLKGESTSAKKKHSTNNSSINNNFQAAIQLEQELTNDPLINNSIVDTAGGTLLSAPLSQSFRQLEHNYTEQTDRSLTVMIPRAKYRHSVLPQTHQLTMERNFKQSINDSGDITQSVDYTRSGDVSTTALAKYKSKKISSGSANNKCSLSSFSSGALVSAGFEVSAIVGNSALNSIVDRSGSTALDGILAANISSGEGDATVMGAGSVTEIITTTDSDNLPSNMNKKVLAELPALQYNTYKCEKDLIHSMDVWLENIQQHELTAEARSFDETTVQAPTKSMRIYFENQNIRTTDEANTMTERDIGSTLLLPHTHLYKSEKQESEMSGFESF